jgi:AcrR family transcriptional regulator
MQVLKPEIKNKILNVSEQMFFKKGYLKTSTRDIAKKSGISVSNLYKYFKNKEDLFYEITSFFYNNFKKDFNNFINHENENFNLNKIELVVNKLAEIIKNNRIKFVIIFNKSEGTKYENSISELIQIFENHIIENIIKDLIDDFHFLSIIAKNFFMGILDIAKNYKNNQWVDKNLRSLVKYHVAGISQFYK